MLGFQHASETSEQDWLIYTLSRSFPLPSDGTSKKSSPVRLVLLIRNHELTLSHGLQALLCPSQHKEVVDAFLTLRKSFPFLCLTEK